MFPVKNRVSDKYSPLTIVAEAPLPGARVYPIDFGAYAEVFEDNRWFQNLNCSRSIPTIALELSPYRHLG